MRPLLLVSCCLVAAAAPVRQGDAPSLNDVLHRMSQYVAAYGARASMFVGEETYTQHVEATVPPKEPLRFYDYVHTTRRLVSEFAIVKAGSGGDWIGYRDVVEVNEKAVVDRRDRLLALLTAPSADADQLKKIADESARYNIGPIIRNFNVPTTTLFFFHPGTIAGFSFKRKGTKEIDGVATWELEFKERVRPTLVRTRSGRDVPCEGTVWVAPGDGVVVRTRLELRNFADDQELTMYARLVRLESLAQIEVTYRLDQRIGAWLPLTMSELYEGPMPATGGGTPLVGRTTAVAEYAGFKRFETSAKIVVPK
jgi:hypothetical protein